MTITENLQEAVRKLFKEKKVDLVAGYEVIENGQVAPCFIEKEDDIQRLVFNELCVFNLATYIIGLIKGHKDKKIGIVAKGCDVKAIIGLIQEQQFKREDVVIIGVECYGQKEASDVKFMHKCKDCAVHIPKENDEMIKEPRPSKPKEDDYSQDALNLESMNDEERRVFWGKEFDKCIRCYACRHVCPFCYCEECLVDSTMPQWCSPVPSSNGNYMWNIIRAYHLAGRCVGCDECERVCPVDIPLSQLNSKMAKEIKKSFDYTAGESYEAKLPFNKFEEGDQEDFIK